MEQTVPQLHGISIVSQSVPHTKEVLMHALNFKGIDFLSFPLWLFSNIFGAINYLTRKFKNFFITEVLNG